jgi:hypothetical protein
VLNVPTDDVSASSGQSLSATGTASGDEGITLEADGTSSVDGQTLAAGEGETQSSSGSGSGENVQQKANNQLASAENTQSTAGGTTSGMNTTGTSSTPNPTTSDNGGDSLSLAGAITINIVNTSSTATLAPGMTVNAGAGQLALKTSADTVTTANANGATKTNASVGVGAAISINVVNIVNKANTEGAVAEGTGLDIEAGMPTPTAGSVSVYSAGSSSWQTVSFGPLFPLSPTNGEYFNLTAPNGTTIPGVYRYNAATLSWGLPLSVNSVDSLPGSAADGTIDQVSPPPNPVWVFSATANSWQLVASGITLPTKPNNGDYFNLTQTSGDHAPGIYQYNQPLLTWGAPLSVNEVATLPSSAGAGTLDQPAAHEVSAVSTSGASDGTDVVVAGSLAMNIVTNDSEAVLAAGGGTPADSVGAGALTLNAYNDEADIANAKSTADGASEQSGNSGNSSGGTGSGTTDSQGNAVGVGASVALNILTSTTTKAEIEPGVGVTGTPSAITVTANSTRTVKTNVEAGTSGGQDGISPAVALVVLDGDAATAEIGSSSTALSGGGAVTVSATHSIDASGTEGSADAAGSSVAVGADISINVIVSWSTDAEVDRSVTGRSVAISATSTVNSGASSKASAKGSSSSSSGADQTANNQVANNPNTSGTGVGSLPSSSSSVSSANGSASSESGDSGGGVGVAAAISVDWVQASNNASIGNGANVSATGGAVDVQATDQTTAIAKALGLAATLQESDADVAAAVGLNVVQNSNTATVGTGSTVTSAGSGAGITVAAITPNSNANTFIVWGIAGAGGQNDASVAASIGVQVISYTTTASVGAGSTLTSGGGISVNASDPIALQNVAVSAALSIGGDSVGGAISVNVIDSDTTEAYIDSSTTNETTVNAAGALSVNASTSLTPLVPNLSSLGINNSSLPFTLPALSSIAIGAAAGSGDAAVTGSFIIDVYAFDTQAYINNGAQVNQTTQGSGQSISVQASDSTSIVNVAGGLALSTGDAGVGVGVIVDVINKTLSASIGSSANVYSGGNVNVAATATESYFGLAIEGSASGDAGVSGSVVVVALNQGSGTGTSAEVGGSTTLDSQGNVGISATDTANNLNLSAGQISFGGSAGVGASVVTLVRGEDVDAGIGSGAAITANGSTGLSVNAAQTASPTLIAIGGSGGEDAGVAGSVSVDVLSDTTNAHIDQGTTVNCGGGTTPSSCTDASSNAGQSVAVTASDTTTAFDTAGALAIGGDAGVGAGVDVQVINKTTTASIGANAIVLANGDVTDTATSSENVTSISVGAGFGGTAAVTVNAGVPVIGVTTEASIGSGAAVQAGDSVNVAANEGLTLDAIAGNVSGGGSAAVGAAGAVPIIHKTTKAWIGSDADVNALGTGGGATVASGAFNVQTFDPRFNPADAIEGDGETINLAADDPGYVDGFTQNEAVRYDNGGGSNILCSSCGGGQLNGGDAGGGSGGSLGATYYVNIVSPSEIQLMATPNGPILTGLSAPGGGGESQRFVGANQVAPPSDDSPRFSPNDVSGSIITLPYQPDFSSGDTVVYGAGGGTPIGGLTDGGQYTAINVGGNSWKLEDSGGNPITLTSAGTSRSQSLVKKGDEPSADASTENQASVSPATTNGFEGVAVTANNTDNIAAIGASASISGSVGVSVSGSVTVDSIDTEAYVGQGADINCNFSDTDCANNVTGAGSGQSVEVAAANSFRDLAIAASLAIGGDVGVGAGVAVRVASITTKAYVDDSSTVHAQNTIAITASGQESLVSVAAGVGGGTVGIAGSVSVSVITATTYAYTGTGVTLDSNGNVLIQSGDATQMIGVAGSAAGGFVGVAAGVGVDMITKDTEAYIGAGSAVNGQAHAGALSGVSNGSAQSSCNSQSQCFGTFGSFRGVAVQAQSSETIFGLAASIAAGAVGVGAAVDVNIATVTTKAFVGPNAGVNTESGAAGGQTADVSALDYAHALTIGGSVGAGVVGVGAGVDIGVLNETIQAYTGDNSTVDAAGDVDIYALEHQDVQTIAIAFGAGFVGASGAVSVWTVGTESTSTYNQGAGGVNPTSGSRSNQNAFGSGSTSGPGSADATASGQGGGYMSILNGTSNQSTPPTWTSGTGYSKNSFVTYDGHYYQAAVNNPDPNIAPDNTGAPTWGSGNPYNSGDIVQYDGSLYQANNSIASDTTAPSADDRSGGNWTAVALWTNVDGQFATNNRISSAIGNQNGSCDSSASDQSASNQLACSQQSGSVVSSELESSAPPNGTSAEVYGNLGAGGNVNVAANGVLDLNGVSGAAAAGFVGFGAGILVLNVEDATNAGIGVGDTGSSVSAGSGGSVNVTVNGTDSVDALAFDGDAGVGAIGAAVAVVNDSSSQEAQVGDGASIPQAGAGITVKDTVNRSITTLTPQVSIGGLAAGAAVATTSVSGNDEAVLGDVNVGSGAPVGGITVQSTDSIDVSSEAVAIAAGAIAAAGAVAWTDLSGETLASSGAHGSDAGGMTVTASGDHSNVKAATINVAGGVGALAVTIRHAEDDRTTEADTTASATPGAALSSGGAVSVTATATNEAQANDLGPNITLGGGTLSVVYGIAEVGGATRVRLDGSVSKSSSITALAYGDDTANAPVFQLGVSVLGAGGIYSDAEITSGAGIEALVDSDASLTTSGAVCVEAQTAAAGTTSGSPCPTAATPVANTATANVQSISFGLALSVSVLVSKAAVNGDVRATLDGTVNGSSSITVEANSANDATATTTTVNLGLASISASGASADIGSGASTDATAAGSSSLTSSGAINFSTNSANDANASSDGGTGGVVAIGIDLPSATVEGATNTGIGGNVSGSSSGVTATATSANQATSTSFVVAVGLGAGAGSDAQATITGNAATTACGGVFSGGSCGGSGTWNVPGGAVSFSANSNNVSSAATKGIGAGVITINVMTANATVGGPTSAGFDASLGSAGTPSGSLTVSSTAQNVATADDDIDSGGAFTFDSPTANSDIASSAGTYAGLGSNATVDVTGQVLIQAQLGSDGTSAGNCSLGGACGCQNGAGSCSSAFAHGGSGGLIGVGTYQASADAEAPVTAEMAGDVQSARSLVVNANGANDAEADTQSLGIGGFAFNIDISLAQVGSGATTQALVDQGAAASTTGSGTGFCGTGAATGVCVEAASANTANAFSDGATVGLIAIGAGLPTAIVDAGTKAYYDGSVGSASGVTITAGSANTADARSAALTVGLVSAQGALAQACIGQQTSNGPDYCQRDSAFTDAIVGPDAQLGLVGGSPSIITGTVTVNAQAANNAQAISGGSAFGLVSIQAAEPTAADYSSTDAELLGNVGGRHIGPTGSWVGDPGAASIEVTATAGDVSLGKVSTEGGGFVAASASTATASTNPVVTAQLGAGHIAASGNITVVATSHTSAGAYSDATQGGFVNLQVGLTSKSSVNPAVSATVNGGFVWADGTITISATHGSEPGQYSDGTITGVNGDTLYFTGLTGLNTGDTVTYQEPGSGEDTDDSNANSIPGLTDGDTYGVITTGTSSIELGVQFTFGQKSLGPDGSTTQVDQPAATLQFANPDNLHTGDVVSYNPNGGTPITYWNYVDASAESLPAGLYVVEVVSATQIRLTSLFDFALQFLFTAVFNSGDVSGNTFNFSPGGTDYAVTYEAPEIAQFNGADVDVEPNGESPDAPAQCGSSPCYYPDFLDLFPNGYIYTPGYTFSSGDQVVYGCVPLAGQSSCSGVGGLTLGDTYTVIQYDSSFVELDPTGDTDTGDVIALDPGGSGIQELIPVDASSAVSFDGVNGVDDNTPFIYAPGNGFTSGEQVTYGCQSSCSALGGLTLGYTYTVIPYLFDPDFFSLDPAGTTDPSQVITVTYGSGNQVLTPVDVGIPGLVNGDTYYEEPNGSGGFTLDNLPSTDGGAQVSINAGGSEGTNRFVYDPYPLLSSGSGTQQLIISLGSPSSAGDGTMLGVGAFRALLGADDVGTAASSGVGGGFVNVQDSESDASVTPTVTTTIASKSSLNATDITISAASAANVDASSSNAGGGFVSVGSSSSTATADNTVTTKIVGGASLNALEDVQVLAFSTEDPTTDSEIGGGGLYAGSDSHATANTNHQDLVEIAGSVTAGRTVLAEGAEGFNGSLISRSDAAGLGASSHANQDGEALNIGSNMSGNTSQCDNATSISTVPGGCAVAGTIVSGTVNGQEIYLSGEVGLQHVLDGNGNVTTGTLPTSVTPVQVNGVNGNAQASSHADALGAGSDATAEINVSEVQGVELDNGANLVGNDIELHARAENQSFTTDSDADCGCGGGHAGAYSPLGYHSNSLVNGEAGSQLSTSTLLVDTYQAYGWSYDAHSHGGAFVSHDSCGGSCDETANDQDRNIYWNSTTFLLGAADPVLTVNQNGTIVALSNDVYVYTNASDSGSPLQIGSTINPSQTIYVAPILNNAQPEVLFEANEVSGGPASQISSSNGQLPSSSGPAPLTPAIFIVQDTFGSVTIINESDRPMVMQGTGGPSSLSIDVVNTNMTTGGPALINISVDNGEQAGGNFTFGLKQLFVPTTVLVESIRGPPTTGFPLTFQGGIYNPLGSTTLRSDRGDIVVATTGQFTSNALSVTATDGSVGCATSDPSCSSSYPLNAVLVEYGTGPAGSPATPHQVSLSGEAYDDINMTLTYAERDTNVLSSADVTPSIGPLHAGRNLVISVLDSYQGVNKGTVGGINIAGFTPDNVPTTRWTKRTLLGPFEDVPTIEFFQPDPTNAMVWICSTETANCFMDAYVLIAFGTDQTQLVDSDYTFTDLTAGNDIYVDHASTASRITFTADTNVDGAFTDPNGQVVSWDANNNVGNISFYTNGSIIDTETASNLRVGQIIASGVCTGGASLCGSTPVPADVTLYSPAAVLNASRDGYVPQQTPTAIGTNVIARNITITAGNNGLAGGISGQGGVGTPDLFLTTQVNADGPDASGDLGVLTVTDTQASRATWTSGSIGTNLPPAAGGTWGVFITQTRDQAYNTVLPNGDMEVNTIITNSDVTLTTCANGNYSACGGGGSIRDARNNGAGSNSYLDGTDTYGTVLSPNVIGNSIDLNAIGGSVGDASGLNDLKIYSSANNSKDGYCGQSYTDAYQDANYQNAASSERAVNANCSVSAQADGNVYLTETPGSYGVLAPMDVLLAWARNGNVRLTTTDTGPNGSGVACVNSEAPFQGQAAACANPAVTAGNDILLLNSGRTLVTPNSPETTWGAGVNQAPYGTTPTSNGLIEAQNGNVKLVSADDVVTDPSSQILATTQSGGPAAAASGASCGPIAPNASDPNQPKNGTGNIDICGDSHPGLSDWTSVEGTTIVLRGVISPGAGGLTRVFGNTNADAIIFDQTWLGGETRAYGSATPTPPGQFAPVGDGTGAACTTGCDDTFIVNRLQSMVALGQDVATGNTLTLDGQSGNNTYDIYTSGSQFTQNNYTVSVLGTHAPSDGSDTLNIYGYDTYTGNTPNQTGVNPATWQNYAFNDLFLLRSTPYITGETGARPSLYQGTGDCSATDSTTLSNTTAAVCSGGAAFVALLHATLNVAQSSDVQGYLINNGTTTTFGVERINYDSATNGGLHVYSLGGNDYFASDDNATTTYIDGGPGNNTFQIGQLYGLQRTSSGIYSGNLASEDAFAYATIATVDGWLSRGNSSPMVIDGGTGNDTFTVYSNQAPLKLDGEGGNDTFTVRAFALAETDSNGNMIFPNNCDPNTTPSCLPCPLYPPWANQVGYALDAPVSVDGGTGFDTLTIVGTEYPDHFVVVGQGIFGAGLSVSYTNVLPLYLNTHTGGDTIDVLSTPTGVTLGIYGGEYDHVNIDCGSCLGAGNGVINGSVYAEDTNGTSAVINQSILTYSQWCQDLTIPGVSLSVAQATAGPVVISQPAGGLTVAEDLTGPIGTIASYDVQLAQQPNCGGASNCTVYVTINSELGTLLNRSANPTGDSILLALGANPNAGTSTSNSDFYQHVVIDGTAVDLPQRTIVLVFTTSNWDIPQVVSVGAMNTPAPANTQVYELSTSVISADPVFNNAVVSNVDVTKLVANKPAIVVTNLGNTDVPGLYNDGVTTTGSTKFTSASAYFVSSDVGQAIIETDGHGLIPAGTTIVAVLSPTTVTLSKAATANGTCIVFALPSRVTPPARFSDGSASGTTTFSSATANFTLDDLGQPILETDGGGHILGGTVITGIVNATTVTLSSVVSTATGIAFELPTRLDGFSSYRDGVSTAGSTTFSSATAAFNTGDIGRPIVETDTGSVFAAGTVILAVISSTQVTLSAPALASATGIAFALPARNASNTVLAGIGPTGIVDYYTITLATRPTGTVILDLNPGYQVTLSSTDSRFTQLSAPWGLIPGCYEVTFGPTNWNIPVVIAVTATLPSGWGDESQWAFITANVDKHSTSLEYAGVNTYSSPLVITVANQGTGAIVQPSSGLIVVKCGNSTCTLPGPGASYTVRMTEPPPSLYPLTVVLASDGQTVVVPGGQVSYQNVNQASYTGTVAYNAAAGTLTLSPSFCFTPNWFQFGFAVGQLFQINGTGPLYKIQSLTATVLTVTPATLNQLTGAETVMSLPFTGSGTAKMTLNVWAAVVTFNCSNWYAPVTVSVFADPYFKDPTIDIHQLEFANGPFQLTGAAVVAGFQVGGPCYYGVPSLPIMLPDEKNAEPFGYPDIPPTPTVALNPVSDSGVSNSDYITNINNPLFITTDVDPATTVAVYLNGVLYTTCTTATNVCTPGAHFANGVYNVTAVATNPLGFHSAVACAPMQLVIDATPPSGSFSVSGSKTIGSQVFTTSTAPTLLLSFHTAVSCVGISSIRISTNGGTTFGAPQAYTSSVPVTLGPNGIYTVEILVTDVAGNTYLSTLSVEVETTGPTISASLSTPQQSIGYDGTSNITLTESATDPSGISSTTYTLDGCAFSGSTINIYTLTAGTHTLVVKAVNGLGTSSSTTLTFSVHPSVVGVEDLVKYDFGTSCFTSSIESTLLGYFTGYATQTMTQIQADLTNFMNAVTADTKGSRPTISSSVASLLTNWAQDLYTRE